MFRFKPGQLAALAVKAGVVSLITGLLAFVYNWHIVGGGWQWFPVLLFPGNLVLDLFTEEIHFWPKLALQMAGQFLVTVVLTYTLLGGVKSLFRKRND
ncbi:hypothetical protein [Bowmanella dokdonensis]|uniref:Uncharacterized protein n=1 Tax=Bowmanella dokdonensis TaxID=751969 RepID=A0A939DSS5_9ALTE|nr:hypothetical protein [Bowmanella dokdonensis]MBN7827246.1 hypothetical protein [Bowmanella dokdonensis]